ncbi:MAG: EI24 domain-containing protein [Bdellovibrionales bacterium]|nr:EI24 domain-containing protein [Bdellovibrionales bacterium]
MYYFLSLFTTSARRFCSCRRLLLLAVGPIVIGLVSFGVIFSAIGYYSPDLSHLILGFDHGWLKWGASAVISLLGVLVAALLSWVVSLLIGGWFIEEICLIGLSDEGVLPLERKDVSLFSSLVRSGFQEAARAVVILIVLGVVFVLSFFPFLGVVGGVIGLLLVGFEVIEIPLALAGLSLRERWILLRNHKSSVFAVGFLLAASAALPFALVVLAPFIHFFSARLAAHFVSSTETSH